MPRNWFSTLLSFGPFAILFLLILYGYFIDAGDRTGYGFFMFLFVLPTLAVVSFIGVLIKFINWKRGRSKTDLALINLYITLFIFVSPFTGGIVRLGIPEVAVLLSVSIFLYFLIKWFPSVSLTTQLLIIIFAWAGILGFMNLRWGADQQAFIENITHHSDLVRCESSSPTREDFLEDYCSVEAEDGKNRFFKVSLLGEYGYSYEVVSEEMYVNQYGVEKKIYTLRLFDK